MKLSFMTFSCPNWTFDQVLAAAIQHGYHGIEFRCDANHRHGVEITATAEQRHRFRDRLEGAGIEPCCLAVSLKFISPDVLRALPERLELAADIGCPALRVFCGKPPENMHHGEMMDICSRQLRDGAEMARQANLEVWLETHDAVSRAADVAAIVREADHPAIGINYDNMHPFRAGETIETTVAHLGNFVRHTHFHDAIADAEQVVITRLDEGEMPMDLMFQELIKMGFDGYLSGEWFDNQYGDNAGDALEAYHEDMTRLAERNAIQLG